MIKFDKNHARIACIHWLLKAMSTNKNRIALNRIHVANGFATTSNGKQLHQIAIDEETWPPGDYEIVKNLRTLVWVNRFSDEEAAEYKFPNISQVTPKNPETWPHQIELNHALPAENPDLSPSINLAKVIRALKPSLCVNMDYFAISSTDMDTVQISDTADPLVFRGLNRMAILMHIRAKE